MSANSALYLWHWWQGQWAALQTRVVEKIENGGSGLSGSWLKRALPDALSRPSALRVYGPCFGGCFSASFCPFSGVDFGAFFGSFFGLNWALIGPIWAVLGPRISTKKRPNPIFRPEPCMANVNIYPVSNFLADCIDFDRICCLGWSGRTCRA